MKRGRGGNLYGSGWLAVLAGVRHRLGVIRAVPRSIVKPSYGYKGPGYYITLTTCTPEFTSRYRMVVWGESVSMRPRT